MRTGEAGGRVMATAIVLDLAIKLLSIRSFRAIAMEDKVSHITDQTRQLLDKLSGSHITSLTQTVASHEVEFGKQKKKIAALEVEIDKLFKVLSVPSLALLQQSQWSDVSI
jgi:hypothetical protein